MVIAKKIKFGQTANASSYVLVNPVNGSLYIPVTGYTKNEVQSAWWNTSLINIPNKFAELGIIGAGGSCYNPGFFDESIFDVHSYSVFCDVNYNPDCIMPHIDAVSGKINNDAKIGYCNENGDGIFFSNGEYFTLVVNNTRVVGPIGGGMGCLNLSNGPVGNGTILFMFLTSDEYIGLAKLSTAGSSNSSLNWFTRGQTLSIINFLETLEPLPEDEDPYAGGEYSTPSDGTGDFNRPGEDVDIPALPSFDASDAGFVTLYTPTLTQLNNLANYLWSNDIASVIQKMFANPMDAVIGLAILPGPVPYVGARAVTVGNVNTGVSMNLVSSQFYTVDCGSLTISNYSGSYLDYNPHTKIEIYLPYIGMRSLNADDVMGKSVNVVYHVDALSGACVAYIKVGGTVLYTFLGQCACSVPISGGDYTQVINGVLNIAGAIGTTIATGGASAPFAISSIASTALNGGLKTSCEKSGAISGTGGLLSIQRPYLIITTPRQCLPLDQNKYIGYPSFITENLSDLTGYTEVYQIHLENVPATGEELTEIENLLKGGVIL